MKSGWIGRFYLIFDCVIFVKRVYIQRMMFFVKIKLGQLGKFMFINSERFF